MQVGVFYPTLNMYGGGEFVAVSMVNALAQNGHDVTLFCDSPIKQADVERFFGTKINDSAKIIVKTTRIQPRGLLDFYHVILQSYIFKRLCDVWIDVYSCRVFPWTNICYIHFPFFNHERFTRRFPYFRREHPSLISLVPSLLLEKNMCYGKKRLLFANSQYTAEEIKRFLGKEAVVLYPPVSNSFFQEPVSSDKEDLAVTVSRFAQAKGLEKILDIAEAAPENVRFALIGRVHDQAVFNRLQESISRRDLNRKVQLHPNISRNKSKELLRKAKVYLHLKEGEHFGISIVEGMAMGCTPIVHNSGGAREFVPKQGLYDSSREASEKIAAKLENWSWSEAVTARQVAENFKEENFALRFMEMFDKFLN